MKRIFLLIYIFLTNCIFTYAVDVNEVKDLGEQAKQFNTQAKDLLKSINPSSPDNQAKYAGVASDVTSALQKTYNDTYDKVEQLYNKMQDPNASPEDIQKVLDDAKGMMSGLKDEAINSVTDAVKKNEFFQELDSKYKVLDKGAGEILGNLNNIKDFGLGFNMPVGFEGEFGEVYFYAALDNMTIMRGESLGDNMTKAEAVVKVTLPFLPDQGGKTNAISFKGDIFFKKGDPNQRSRIYLGDNYTIPLIKEKADLVFVAKPNEVNQQLGNCSLPNESEDGGNYVEFNCNGIQAVHLQGYVDFRDYLVAMQRGMVQDKMPEKRDENGNIIEQKNTNPEYEAWIEKEDKNVRAVFSLDAKGGMVSKLCISSPFKVKGAKNFVFDVKDAVIDLSTIKNAPDFELPSGYLPAGLSVNSWTGFALKELTCYFPEDYKLNDSDDITSATVYDMFIDEYGFTGKAKGENLVNKNLGNAGARISLKHVEAEFYQNEFLKGEMNGDVDVPFLKKADKSNLTHANTEDELLAEENKDADVLNFEYSIRVSLATDVNTGEERYGFAGKAVTGGNAGQTYKVPFTDKATVTLNPGTGVYISNYYRDVEGVAADASKSDSVGRLRFKVVLNGSLDLASGKKSGTLGSGVLGYDCKFEGIAFEGLTFQNVGKKVSIDRLALKGKLETKFLGMTLTLNELGWSDGRPTVNKEFDVQNNAYGGLLMDAKIQVIPNGSGNIAPDFGGLFKTFYGKVKNSGVAENWHFGGIDVNHIALDADLGAVKLKGEIDLYKDDETFGKGFKGNVDFTIDPIDVTAGVQACFGTTNESVKYWFTKASCSFPNSGIPVFSGLYLKSLTGGAYYHMNDNKNRKDVKDWPEEYGPDDDPPFIFADVKNYVPDEKIKFGLIAGMGLIFGGENLANLNAEMNIKFASNFAVDQLTIGGDFSMICPTPKFVTDAADKLKKVQDKMNNLASQAKVCSALKADFLQPTDPKDKDGKDILGDIVPSDGTIHGWAKIDYIPSEKFFNLNSAVKAEFGDLIEGYASVNMRISPEKWYFRIGSDTYPAYLRFLGGIAEGKTYFMTGELPSATLKPLSPNAENKFKSIEYPAANISSGKTAHGMAFAVNTRAALSFDKFPLVFAGFYLEGGCDLLLTDCPNLDDAKWRGKGSIYGDFGVDLGVNLYFAKIPVIEANAFFGLKGAAPSPLQGDAIASFDIKVGHIIDTYADLHVHMGPKKEVVCH